MKLMGKTISVLAGVIALSIALNYFVLRHIGFPGFVDLEQDEAERNVMRSQVAIQNELEHLSTFVWDWAQWDDSYKFIQNSNQEYIESNLTIPSFTSNEINLIMYYNIEGKLVWGGAYDLNDEESIDLSQLPSLKLSPKHSLLNHTATDSAFTGVALTSRGAMLIASRPITTSEGTGPIQGSLLMGKFLTDPVIEALRQQTHVDFNVWPINSLPDTSNEREALAQLKTNDQIVLREMNKEILTAYSVMDDYADNPAILLRANTPRSITSAGIDTINVAVVGLIAAGIISLLVMAIAIQRVVVGPLMAFTSHALRIGQSGDLSRRLVVKRNDELGLLGREFDRMLELLQDAQRRLADQSFQSGLAEMASVILHNVRNQLSPLTLRICRLKQASAGTTNHKLKDALKELAEGSASADRSANLIQFVQLATDNLLTNQQEVHDQLDFMSQQVNKLGAILAEQERVSRAELLIQSVALKNVVNEALDFIPEDLGRKIDVRLDPSVTEEKAVLAQEFILKQILVNLLVNAAEAIEEGEADAGRIEIDAVGEQVDGQEMIHLRVRDNGHGIEPDILNSIFERGFTTKGDEKRGFGLHWSANNVANMDGRIWAKSEGRDRGAVLHVLLPTSGAVAEAA